MNLIIDVNPYLKRSYKISQFTSNNPILSSEYENSINEDAINFSRIFSMFDINSRIFTYLGGFIGANYENILKEENSNLSIFKIRDTSLEKIYIYDGIRELNILTKSPRITNDEISEIYSLYSKEIEDMNYVIFSNSHNSPYEEEFFMNFMNIAYRANIKTAISLNEENIKRLIQFRPTVVLVDKEALEAYSGKEVNFNWEISKIITSLVESGINKVLYLTKKGHLQLQDATTILTASSDEIDFSQTSKDKILAGFLAGMNKRYDDEMSLKIALASCKLALKKEELNRDASDIKANIKNIKIERLNVNK